jgi:hypothetical protein
MLNRIVGLAAEVTLSRLPESGSRGPSIPIDIKEGDGDPWSNKGKDNMEASLSTADDIPHGVVEGPTVKLMANPPVGIARRVEEEFTRDTLEGSLERFGFGIVIGSGLSQNNVPNPGFGDPFLTGRVNGVIHNLEHRLVEPVTERVGKGVDVTTHRGSTNPSGVGREVKLFELRHPHFRGLRDDLERGESIGEAKGILEEEKVIIGAPLRARALSEEAESPRLGLIGFRGRDRELEEEGEDTKDKNAVNTGIVLLAKVEGGPLDGAGPKLGNGRSPASRNGARANQKAEVASAFKD